MFRVGVVSAFGMAFVRSIWISLSFHSLRRTSIVHTMDLPKDYPNHHSMPWMCIAHILTEELTRTRAVTLNRLDYYYLTVYSILLYTLNTRQLLNYRQFGIFFVRLFWIQIEVMNSNIKKAEMLINKCPSCFYNFIQPICEMTCSPLQTTFMTVEGVDRESPGKPSIYMFNSKL